jgi:excisionase family DNA binding protein
MLITVVVVARPKDLPPLDLVTISEAAELLGVSLPTMRRWDEAGKFKAHRHPMSRYRLYRRADVLKLRQLIERGAA